MTKKSETLDYRLRHAAVSYITSYYRDNLREIRSSELYSYVQTHKELSNFDYVVSVDTKSNSYFPYLQKLLKEICGDGERAAERYKYYYLKSLYKTYEDIIGYSIGGTWSQLALLIAMCASLDIDFKDTGVSVDIHIVNLIHRLTNYIIALFTLYQKTEGYGDLLVACIENVDIDDVVSDIIERSKE